MGRSAIILYCINNLSYRLISIKILEEIHTLIVSVQHIVIEHLKILP